MNSVLHQVGWVLLHSLWQGTVIGAAFELCRRAWRHSANARYLAGCVALLLMGILPLVTVFSGLTPVLPVEPHLPSGAPAALGPVWTSGAGGAGYVQTGAQTAFHFLAGFLRLIAPILAGAWALGVAILSVRLIRGAFWARRIRYRGTEPVETAWLEMLDYLRSRLEISRVVCLFKSAMVEVPTVIGWLRPVILLPAATLAGLTPRQLEAILAHELAHVRRWDYIVNAFQCVLETLMFYHPVMWWISRCVREERENCCDDLVVKVCGNRAVYARALATLEESRAGASQWALAAGGGSLVNRIRRLAGASPDDEPGAVRQAVGLGAMGFGLVLILAGIYLGLGQPTYQATVRLKIERDFSAQLASNDGRATLSLYDPYFFQTEFQVIQSEFLLGKVIGALDLTKAWARNPSSGEKLTVQEAVSLLRKRIDLRPVRNTSLIELRVASEQSDEAANIANLLADSYKTYRFEQHRDLGLQGVNALEKRYVEQDQKVHKAAAELDQLRVGLKIPDFLVNENGPTAVSGETLRRIESIRVERKYEFTKEETLMNALKTLRPEQLVKALPTAAPDALLSSLLEQLTLAEQNLLSVRRDYGPDHLETVKSSSRVEDLGKKIKDRVEGIMLGLETRLSALRVELGNLDKEVEEATQRDQLRTEQARPFFEKKRELDDLVRFRQVLGMKIASENVDRELPKGHLVEIVDRAIPSRRPIAPNRPRAAALILLGLLMDLTGLLILKGPGIKGPGVAPAVPAPQQ